MQEENLEQVEETQDVEQTQQEPTFMSEEDDNVIKINLDAPPVQENNEKPEETNNARADDTGVVGSDENTGTVQEQEEVQPEEQAQEESVIEEVTEEPVVEQEQQVQPQQDIEVGVSEKGNVEIKIPGSVEKLVDFMNETGGNLEDYVKLNKDYSNLDSDTVLREYYSQTKPHLTGEEVSFLMEDQFNYDEEVDEERDIRRKKLALKEQVANAKAYLDGQKSKYYQEVKAGINLTEDQKQALNFYEEYNKKSEETKALSERQKSVFNKKTNDVFNDKFKGFEYNVGDKKYRFKVNDINAVKQNQSDINNFLGKFLGKDQTLEQANEYHKSLFTAMNPDAIAKHFYEQGKADAVKDSVTKAKNIDMNPRGVQKEFNADGVKFRVLGDNSSDFKFKIKKRN